MKKGAIIWISSEHMQQILKEQEEKQKHAMPENLNG